MLRQFCLISFSLFTTLQAQKADSLFQLQKAKAQQTKDSIIKSKHEQVDQTIKSKQESITKSINQKTDSTVRAKAKNTVLTNGEGIIQKEKDKLRNPKAKLDNKWSNTKQQFKIPFKLSLEVRSENYATTAQNPVIRNEPVYSRFYIAPTISVFGLPFKGNFFLTTENNNTYKSNFFTFKFDANAIRQHAAEKIQKEIDEARKLDRKRQFDLQKNALETQRYEEELNRVKGQIPNVDVLQGTIQKQAEEKSKGYIGQQQKLAEEKLKNASEEEKLRIKQELEQKQDSVINHYKKQAGDSIFNAKGQYADKLDTSGFNEYKEKIDTAQLGKYLRMQQKLENLQLKKRKLEDLRQLDSTKILQKVGSMRNPDNLRKMAKEHLPDNKFIKTVLAVDRFGIGIVNPQYSEFTLFAASVKGLDIGINKDKWFYDLTIGRTTKQFTGPFLNTKPVYDRNIAVTRVGYGELKGNHLSTEYLYANDLATENKSIPKISNGVLNLSMQFNMLKNTKVEANAAQSNYKESFVERETNYVSSNAKVNQVMGPSANKAFQLKATQTINENAKIEAQVKQTGAAFRTVGNPFLRRNFREFEVKYEHQFFKKKVKFSGFYKEMRDNLIELNKATNRLKGYGLKLSTSFEKYPNLSVSYSPYQQGNNHPDSAYRTNNQFSVINGVLTYKKRFKALNWNGLMSYTQSAMQINERGSVAYKLISTVHTFQIGMRNISVISYLSNVTSPFVDSLNSTSVQFNHTYLATKKITVGLMGEQTKYKNGASKTGTGLQASSALFRNFTLSILVRYDRVHKLWHLDDVDVFTGKVVMVWRLL